VHNAEVVRAVLGGRSGPVRDAVLLNAAAAIVAHDAVDGHPTLDAFLQALRLAADSIDSGAAARTLDAWIRASTADGQLRPKPVPKPGSARP
jgi:anthranilate phosphoribosyltransferase